MAVHGGLGVHIDARDIALVVKALRAEADGKFLAKAMRVEIVQAAGPAVADAKQAILSRPVTGHPRSLASLGQGSVRTAIANKVVIEVKGGPNANVGIKAKKTPNVRGFRNAPKRFSDPVFRHKLFGRDTWVPQVGVPGWFDRAMRAHDAQFRQGVHDALELFAREIARRAKE